MDAIKKKNHTVPRGLLKNWVGKSNGKVGLHYFDIIGGKQKFEPGNKAKFAITDYIYVPIDADGKRDDELENWFSVDENGLAAVATTIFQKQVSQPIKPKLLAQFVRSCIALGYRSDYQFLRSGAEHPFRSDQDTENSVHNRAINNFKQLFSVKIEQFKDWRFTILYNLQKNLLIGDQPFFDATIRNPPTDFVSMPIAPNALLFGSSTGMPPDQIRSSVAVVDASTNLKIVEKHNRFVIERARKWVVAKTPEELKAITSEFSAEKMSHRIGLERKVLFGILR